MKWGNQGRRNAKNCGGDKLMSWAIIWTPGWNLVNKSEYYPLHNFRHSSGPAGQPRDWLFDLFSVGHCQSWERGPERRADSHSPTQNTITFGIRIFISLLAIGSAVDMENEFQLLSGGRLVCTAVWPVRCCTLPIPPAGRRHRRRAIARKKGRVGTVV